MRRAANYRRSVKNAPLLAARRGAVAASSAEAAGFAIKAAFGAFFTTSRAKIAASCRGRQSDRGVSGGSGAASLNRFAAFLAFYAARLSAVGAARQVGFAAGLARRTAGVLRHLGGDVVIGAKASHGQTQSENRASEKLSQVHTKLLQ